MSATPPRNGRDASPARSVSPRRDSPPPRGRSASPADKSVSPVPRSRSRSRTPVRRRRSSTPPRGRYKSRSPSPYDRYRRRSSTPPRRRRSYSRSRSRDRDSRRRRSPSPYRRRSPSPYRRRSRSPRDRRDSYRDRDSGYGRPPPARYGGGFDSRGRSPPRGMGRRATPPATGLHMFVAGLNFICTERELEHKFDEFGKVKEARVVRNPATGESRGFGFVALDHDDEVDDAIKALNGAEWNGRRLLVERARHVR